MLVGVMPLVRELVAGERVAEVESDAEEASALLTAYVVYPLENAWPSADERRLA